MTTDAKIANNHVIAVVDGEESAVRAADELASLGYENSRLFQGEAMANTTDAKGEKSNVFQRLAKAFQDHVSEEANYIAQYEEESRAGHPILAVEVKNKEGADLVSEVLQRYGARNVRFFGTLAVA